MSKSSSAGTNARTNRDAPTPQETIVLTTEDGPNTFHRGIGCASTALGAIEELTVDDAHDRGLEACGSCAPDLARDTEPEVAADE